MDKTATQPTEAGGSDSHLCAEFDLDAPMAGSADPFDVLLLVEYRGVWTDRVVTQAVLPPRLRAWLDQIVAHLADQDKRAKVMFIKQLGSEADGDHHLYVATEQSCGVLRLPVLSAVSELSFDALLARLEPVNEALYFVCCNGQRDVCCARLGLPLYRALRQRVSHRAWQISHVGGHRYAPNVLTLPTGALYGRVKPSHLASWLAAVEGGELDFEHLRGRSWLSKAEQVGECYLADGVRRPDSIEVDGAQTRLRYDGVELNVSPGEERTVLPSCGKAPEAVRPLRVSLVS